MTQLPLLENFVLNFSGGKLAVWLCAFTMWGKVSGECISDSSEVECPICSGEGSWASSAGAHDMGSKEGAVSSCRDVGQ